MERYDKLKRLGTGSNADWQKEESFYRAKKRLEKLKGFYSHLAVYVLVNLFLILFLGLKSGAGFNSFAPYSTAIFWGIGLFFHALGVFLPEYIFSKRWEERKLKEFMDRDRTDINRN